jgi:hypothetical protein
MGCSFAEQTITSTLHALTLRNRGWYYSLKDIGETFLFQQDNALHFQFSVAEFLNASAAVSMENRL